MRNKGVLVPFPFDDLSGSKVRPAVCLADPGSSHRHVVLAFITSTVPSRLEPTDIVLDSNASEFSTTGLHVRSTQRLHRMVTIPVSVMQRQLGVLGPELLFAL